MRYIKLFESFELNSDQELKKTLMMICINYKSDIFTHKSENQQSIIHKAHFGNSKIKTYKNVALSEWFGYSEEHFKRPNGLFKLSEMCGDDRIKSILSKIVSMCIEEGKNSTAGNISDYINNDDCDYIAKFLGIKPLDYDVKWSDEEDSIWLKKFGTGGEFEDYSFYDNVRTQQDWKD